jgi:hypothetical protein
MTMRAAFGFFVIEVVTMATLVGLIIHGRDRLSVKLAALGLGGVAMVTTWLALVDLLSRPKPILLEHRPALLADAVLLAGHIVENEAIHVWLQLDDAGEPRAYTLPWSRRRAEELQQALAGVAADGGTVVMGAATARSDDDAEPLFYARPPEPP